MLLKKGLLIFAAVLALLAGVISTRPSSYRVTRSATIKAPPEKIFPLIGDYHKWADWSPWSSRDPNMKVTYDGRAGDVGTNYTWAGNDMVGAGKMVTLAIRSPEYMKIKLEFIKPFESQSISEFTLKPAGGETIVTWDMAGNANFFVKAFTLLSSFDSMIGPDFELGLKQMKELAESTKP